MLDIKHPLTPLESPYFSLLHLAFPLAYMGHTSTVSSSQPTTLYRLNLPLSSIWYSDHRSQSNKHQLLAEAADPTCKVTCDLVLRYHSLWQS
jgi:hypothetical protein